MAASNSLGRTTGQTGSHSPQRVHSLLTKPARWRTVTGKSPRSPSSFPTWATLGLPPPSAKRVAGMWRVGGRDHRRAAAERDPAELLPERRVLLRELRD